MAIAKLKLINITSNLTNLEPVLAKFVSLRCFSPVLSSKFVERVHGLRAISEENPTKTILIELSEIEKEFDIEIPAKGEEITEYSPDKMKTYISTTHKNMKELIERKKNLQEKIQKYENALVQIKNIESMDISLDDLFSCRYIYARVGRLPNSSIDKLNYYRTRPFIFNSFGTDINKEYSWCMYFTSPEYEREVDNIFSSLFFERIYIPDFVHGTPGTAEVQLTRELGNFQKESDDLQKEISSLLKDCDHELIAIKNELLFLEKINEAKKYVVNLGEKFSITGFAEAKDSEKIKQTFSDIDGVEVTSRPAGADKRLKPPTKLKNNWFTRPFSTFVNMYGTPSYADIDPTPFFAITYSLLFGIMFGDVGQGLVLVLLGILLAVKAKSSLGQIAIRIGMFSTFFGFIYGSFFGNETLLLPLYKLFGLQDKPVDVLSSDFTCTLLILAVIIGAALIITSILINIVSRLKKKEYAEMIFSHNGIAGLILYSYLAIGLLAKFLYETNLFTGWSLLIFVGTPVLMIILKNPFVRKFSGQKFFTGNIGGFIADTFFDLYEIALSYLTNTVSFLRVGGFVLSHAGMMLVVYTLMSSVGNFIGQSLIFLFGNLIVMALEGLVVGIQVLRLEYYEMFSRYYEGDGVAFEVFE